MKRVGARSKRLHRGVVQRGQTALETAFVLTMILFITFAVVNYAMVVHTKMIATYAAFMAARSYQVYGDQIGAEAFKEMNAKTNLMGGMSGDKEGALLGDMGKTVTAFRVAEDIFTCALPWVTVPEGDAQSGLDPVDQKDSRHSRCLEGKRKYEKTNIGRAISFLPFKLEGGDLLSRKQRLEEVKGSLSESGRAPLRYGIMSIKYRVPLLFNPMGVFSENGEKEPLVQDEVFVPVLLNPGLSDGLKEQDKNKKDFEDEK